MTNRVKIRKWLSVTSVAVAVFTFCCIYCAGSAGETLINQEIDSIGLNMLSLTADSPEAKLTHGDIGRVRQLNEVSAVYPVVYSGGVVRVYGEEFQSLLWGVGEGNSSLIKIDTLYGQEISKEDVELKKRVCLITSQMAKSAYGRENVVGKIAEVVINGYVYEFEIVGIAEASSSLLNSVVGSEMDNIICIPYTTSGLLNVSNNLDGAGIAVSTGADTQKIISEIEQTISGAYTVRDLSAQKVAITNIIDISKSLLNMVALISLVVAAIGIISESWSEVNDSTREIGIKMAIGAGSLDIVTDVMRKSIKLTLLGTAAGGATALSAFFICATLIGIPAKPRLLLLFPIMILGGVILGAVCSAVPAIKAAGLRPIDSIKM